MRHSAERILTTHAGSLARPDDLRELLLAKDEGRPFEHPELVAERVIKYARLVGRERVIAGTDCGLGPRVGHPKIAWAKLAALVEGARLATRSLWGR